MTQLLIILSSGIIWHDACVASLEVWLKSAVDTSFTLSLAMMMLIDLAAWGITKSDSKRSYFDILWTFHAWPCCGSGSCAGFRVSLCACWNVHGTRWTALGGQVPDCTETQYCIMTLVLAQIWSRRKNVVEPFFHARVSWTSPRFPPQ